MDVGEIALLGAAGVLAGAVGSGGGITSLVSYPALLAVGLPSLDAAVTNVVALVACLPGAALASGPELAGQLGALRRLVPLALVGGGAGAALLLLTPGAAFGRLVPFLLVLASVALLAAPRFDARSDRPLAGPLAMTGLLATSLYNGYFGAGAGVMTLTLLLTGRDGDVARANALKNVVIGAASLAAATAFVASGRVDLGAGSVLAGGLFFGSTLGPAIVRRVPGGHVRLLAALSGLGLAAYLFVRPGG